MAATNDQPVVMLPLVQGYADINAVDSNGWTPLDRAENCHPTDIAQLLAAHGALQAPMFPIEGSFEKVELS